MIVELHATSNGDGTYAVQFISAQPDGLHQYQVPDALVKVDNVVADEVGHQRMHVVVNGREFGQ